MSPFFATFCNIVESSQWQDLRLLEDVTEGLAPFVNFNPSVGHLRELFEILVSLCQTLKEDRSVNDRAL
jgi:hypothetical protein